MKRDYRNLCWLPYSEGCISTNELPSYILDGFGEETISDDDDVRSYDKVGELSNETKGDSCSISDRYSDACDDKSYSMKPDQQSSSVTR